MSNYARITETISILTFKLFPNKIPILFHSSVDKKIIRIG